MEDYGYISNSWYPLYNADHMEKDNPLIERTLGFVYIPQSVIERLRIKTGNYNVPAYVWRALIAESAEEHGAFESPGRYIPALSCPLIYFPLHDVKTKTGEQVFCILGPNGHKKQPWLLTDIYSAADVSVSAYGKYLFPADLKKTRVPDGDRLSYSPFASESLLALLQQKQSEPEPEPVPESEPEPVPESEPEPVPGSEPLPGSETAPESEPAGEPVPEPQPAPEQENAPDAGREPTVPPSNIFSAARPPLPLCATHMYKAYQFYGTLALDGASGRDTLFFAILTVLHWVRARVGEPAPRELTLPAPEQYRSVTEDMLSSYHCTKGYSLDITSLIPEGRWALRVSEFDNGLSGPRVLGAGQQERPGVPGRSIITNVAFCLLPDSDTVEMAVLTEIEDPDKDTVEALPFTFRPAFLRTFLRESALTVTQGIPVRYKELLPLSGHEDFVQLRELMNDPLCSLPAVIFTHDKGDFTLAELIQELEKKYGTGSALRDYLTGVDPDASTPLALPFMPYDPQNYADELFGYARTYMLDSGLGRELSAFLGIQMRPGDVIFWEPACFGGAVQTFGYEAKEDMFRRDEIFKQLKSMAYCYTTDRSRQCLKGIPTGNVYFQPKLKDMEWNAHVARLRKEGADELFEPEYERLQKRTDDLDLRDSELADRENALFIAEQRLRSERLGAGRPGEAFAFLRDPKAFPSTPEAVGRMIRALYPDRIDFTERGWETLKSCTTKPDLLWECFWHMANTLRDLYLRGASKDIDREFRDACGFEHAFSEGPATTEAQMKKRDDSYHGHADRFDAHIKKGGREGLPTFVRAYYKYLPEEQLIVISYCGGDHLENASSRKVR